MIWTIEEVQKLNERQQDTQYHPYTCPNRDKATHPILFHDFGTLIATVNGWICPYCDYTQDWYHHGNRTTVA